MAFQQSSISFIIFSSVLTERTRVLTERSRGEGVFTGHFVSASLDEQASTSLDEQFMSKA
jgi:hypothetical protein